MKRVIAESAAHLCATSTAQHLSYRKVAHELRDRIGFACNNLTPRMVKTAVRCIAPICLTVPTVQTLREFIRKHSAVPSDPHAAFVVSNVDDVDPNGKLLHPHHGFGNQERTTSSRIMGVSDEPGCGSKTTPKWGIKPPPTPFLAIFDPWGGFMPPRGGFIPLFAGVGLSPHRGVLSPYLVIGRVLSLLWGGFIPHFW